MYDPWPSPGRGEIGLGGGDFAYYDEEDGGDGVGEEEGEGGEGEGEGEEMGLESKGMVNTGWVMVGARGWLNGLLMVLVTGLWILVL